MIVILALLCGFWRVWDGHGGDLPCWKLLVTKNRWRVVVVIVLTGTLGLLTYNDALTGLSNALLAVLSIIMGYTSVRFMEDWVWRSIRYGVPALMIVALSSFDQSFTIIGGVSYLLLSVSLGPLYRVKDSVFGSLPKWFWFNSSAPYYEFCQGLFILGGLSVL